MQPTATLEWLIFIMKLFLGTEHFRWFIFVCVCLCNYSSACHCLSFHTLGKRNRGLSVIGSLRHLVSPDKLTEEDAKTAVILGWCVEWVSYWFSPAFKTVCQTLLMTYSRSWSTGGRETLGERLAWHLVMANMILSTFPHFPWMCDTSTGSLA